MQKIIKIFSITVIVLFTLSIYGWMTYHITKGDKQFGKISEPIKWLSQFPDLFQQSVEEVKTVPKTYVKTPNDFKPLNNLDFDLDVLVTHSDTSNARSIVLMNLRDSTIRYRWKVKNPFNVNKRIFNPLLLPNYDIIYSFSGKGMCRIDKNSNIIWKQDSVWAHHSLNLDADGNIWVCSEEPVYYATGLYKISWRKIYYHDNKITKIDTKTGKILFDKSVTDILRENNLSSYLMKSNNPTDPIHLNDIQPALETTKYYKKDDLFLSLRQFSAIIQYRPLTNKVIRIIEGPFVSQHDVDFMGKNSIVVFNNNWYTVSKNASKPAPQNTDRLHLGGELSSNIVQYNFDNDSFSIIGDSLFKANNIFSYTESLQEFIDDDTYFVEEQNSGVLWVIRNNKVLYRNVLKSKQYEGYHHLPNWTRIIKNYE